MARLHVLRVFCDEDGEWGNPLGVFLDGAEVPEGRRQAVAHELGFSETVFVDDAATAARCRIFTPGLELPFAGHPTVGTAWLLAREGATPAARLPAARRAGEVEVRQRGRADLRRRPGRVVAALGADRSWPTRPRSRRSTGRRRRTAAALSLGLGGRGGRGGALALLLARGRDRRGRGDRLGGDHARAPSSARELTIHQGEGSLLDARPLGDGRAEVGGRVVLDEVREFDGLAGL